jgi:hypothetical protein
MHQWCYFTSAGALRTGSGFAASSLLAGKPLKLSLSRNRRESTNPSKNAIPVAVTTTRPMINSNLRLPLREHVYEGTYAISIAFATLGALSSFIHYTSEWSCAARFRFSLARVE